MVAKRQVKDAAMQAFISGLSGQALQPGDDGYEVARRVNNAMVDRKPRVIVRCSGVADITRCITFARENEITLSVRGGGHSASGLAICDDGLVVDLGGFKGVDVNPASRVARVDGGCTWADMDRVTHGFGLATPGGVISTTGVGGLTLGGGFGHLTRRYGLSCDNVISADMILADGKAVTASATENQDLFWAIRGGGGNFGIVTSFQFKLHPVKTVYAGPVFYPLGQTSAALQFFGDFMKTAPRELSAFFAFLIVPPWPEYPVDLHLQRLCGVVLCYCGDMTKAEEVTRPLREFGPPVYSHTIFRPYPAVQTLADPLLPPGLYHYNKADIINGINDEMIRVHLQYGPAVPTIQSAMHIYPLNGAVHDVGHDETAFAYRSSEFTHLITAVDPDPGPMPGYINWLRQYWDALHPYSAGGSYVNFMMDEGSDRVASGYPGNLEKLGKIKKKYDPDNFFHMNQNIAPAA
jgi:FAD/FMN-containing dehydrogenase